MKCSRGDKHIRYSATFRNIYFPLSVWKVICGHQRNYLLSAHIYVSRKYSGITMLLIELGFPATSITARAPPPCAGCCCSPTTTRSSIITPLTSCTTRTRTPATWECPRGGGRRTPPRIWIWIFIASCLCVPLHIYRILHDVVLLEAQQYIRHFAGQLCETLEKERCETKSRKRWHCTRTFITTSCGPKLPSVSTSK